MNFFSPAEVAKNYLATGKAKANMSILNMILLGIMAGMFIGFAGIASTTIAVSIPLASVGKFAGALIFSGGLFMVLVAGSELFTGNTLLIIPVLQKEISWGGMLKNWLFVYIGNLIGANLVAALVVFGHQYSLFSNGMAVSAMSTAVAKVSMTFGDAFFKGILCNILVCVGVWMSFAAKDVASKMCCCIFPVTIFVGCGFEHSIANMYFMAGGLYAKMVPSYVAAATEAGVNLDSLTWGAYFVKNLLPVTLGNIVGGAILVGCIYWVCYLRGSKK